MATIKKLPSGNWRVQVRRKGRYIAETFRRHKEAEAWALDMERRIDQGEVPSSRTRKKPTTFGDLIDLHLAALQEVGRSPRRSKAFTLDALKEKLGKVRMADLNRERLIRFGKDRLKEGAGPVTVGMDLSYIKTIITHAAAVHGIAVSPEAVGLARTALKHLGVVGRSRSRDRRPTADELNRLIAYFDANPRQLIPLARIIRFAVATAMRQDEICRIRWNDIDANTKTVLIRDRKDPRETDGNDQKVPLLAATGFDAWAILQEQKSAVAKCDRIFPYNARSVGTAFRRACRDLKIQNLHFRDLRHEGASRLFEAGFTIEQVALVTGHRDWKMLRRYTNLRPEHLHRFDTARAAASPGSSGEPSPWAALAAMEGASKRTNER